MGRVDYQEELERRIATMPFGVSSIRAQRHLLEAMSDRVNIFEKTFPRMGSILRNQSAASGTFSPGGQYAGEDDFDGFLVIPSEGDEWSQVWIGTVPSKHIAPTKAWDVLPDSLVEYFSNSYSTFTYLGDSGGPFAPQASLSDYIQPSEANWWPADGPETDAMYPVLRTVGAMPKLYCIDETDGSSYIVDPWAHSFGKSAVEQCGPLTIELDKYMSEGVEIFEG